MKKGLLIVNAFLITKKFDEIYNMLVDAFKKADILLDKKTNSEVSLYINDGKEYDYDFVLMWDKDTLLARHFENNGIRVFNSSKAIEICDDKRLTALCLENKDIKMPKTYLSPFCYDSKQLLTEDYKKQLKSFSYPLIMKQAKGSFGQQVYMVNSADDVFEKIKQYDIKEFLLQEIVSSSVGIDCRIQVVGNKVVGSVLRKSVNGDFRSNVTLGGTMQSFDAPQSFKDMAIKVAKIIGLDFCGVDILFGKNGEPILCEVNSNAHFKTMYNATGINVSDHIASYIGDIL